jgi:hypothetical protein
MNLQSVSILLPDEPERERAVEDEGSDEPFPKVRRLRILITLACHSREFSESYTLVLFLT